MSNQRRIAADPLGQTVVFELMMRLFFLHVLGVRPESLQNRRHARRSSTREWVTDGVAAASVSPGIFGPVQAFRGELEAQGRGSLHPHILVWLVGIHVQTLLAMAQGNPERTREVLRKWMRALVSAVESTSQSSVRSLPRQFGHYDRVGPELTLNKAQQSLCRYDGGDEVEEMEQELARSSKQPTEEQQRVIEVEKGNWRRPNMPARALPQKTSVYARPLSDFSVSHCPSYRRYGELSADVTSTVPMSADAWEDLFAADIETLVSQILTHICGESCYKYTKAKCTHICRHGFYHVLHLAGDWKRRRQGKYLRNALFVVKQSEYGMQGRILGFQDHPFECLSNHGAAAVMRSNLDVQDLRRVLPEEHWLHDEEELPSLGPRPEWGYMQQYEWDGKAYVPRHRTQTPREEAFGWNDNMRPEEWRKLLLELMEHRLSSDLPDACDPDLEVLLRLSVASFSDGVNTGYYINTYTTKQCPTMGGRAGGASTWVGTIESAKGARSFNAAGSSSQGCRYADSRGPHKVERQIFVCRSHENLESSLLLLSPVLLEKRDGDALPNPVRPSDLRISSVLDCICEERRLHGLRGPSRCLGRAAARCRKAGCGRRDAAARSTWPAPLPSAWLEKKDSGGWVRAVRWPKWRNMLDHC